MKLYNKRTTKKTGFAQSSNTVNSSHTVWNKPHRSTLAKTVAFKGAVAKNKKVKAAAARDNVRKKARGSVRGSARGSAEKRFVSKNAVAKAAIPKSVSSSGTARRAITSKKAVAKAATSKGAANNTISKGIARRAATPNPGSAFQMLLKEYSRYNKNYYNGARLKKHPNGFKRWIGAGAAIVALIFLMIGSACGFVYLQNLDNNLKGDYSIEQREKIKEKLVSVDEVNEPFYVLLIGSDERSNSDEMGARSDTNILVRVDPVNWIVTMVSIPRDTKITFNNSTIKFNAAYSLGGGAAGCIEAANNLCKVKIAHYAEVNFEGVINLIDTLGGVEVDVPHAISDPQAGDVEIKSPGLQTLNGEQALVFARSRHYYVDGDFSRSLNQRTLVQAVANKVFSLPATDIPSMVQQLSKCVSTDMSSHEIYSVVMQYFNSGKHLTVYSIMLPSTTENTNGISYVVIDEAGKAAMMQAVENGEDPNTVPVNGATTGKMEHYDFIEYAY